MGFQKDSVDSFCHISCPPAHDLMPRAGHTLPLSSYFLYLLSNPLDYLYIFQRLTEVLDKTSMGCTRPSLKKKLCSQPAFVKQSLAQIVLVTFEELIQIPVLGSLWTSCPSLPVFPKPLSLTANTDSPWNTYTCRRLKVAKD